MKYSHSNTPVQNILIAVCRLSLEISYASEQFAGKTIDGKEVRRIGYSLNEAGDIVIRPIVKWGRGRKGEVVIQYNKDNYPSYAEWQRCAFDVMQLGLQVRS